MKFHCRTTEAIQDGGPACLFPKLFLRAPLSSMATRSERAGVLQYGTLTSCHKSLSAFFVILCETITGLFWFAHISLGVVSHLNLHKEVRKRQWKDNLYSTTVRSENEKLTFKSSQQASESKEGLWRHFHMTHVNLLNESDSMERSPQNTLTLTFWNAADNNRTIQVVHSLWLCDDGSRSALVGVIFKQFCMANN